MQTKLALRSQMNIGPQLVITSTLLRASGANLEQLLKNELADNPALELSDQTDFSGAKRRQVTTGYSSRLSPGVFVDRGDRSKSFEDLEETIQRSQSPIERLIEQVSVVADKADREIAIYLLHSLDHRGFLVVPTAELAHELGVSKDVIERVVGILHQLEPPGIGARDIQECFLIQCTHLEAEGTDCHIVRSILALAWGDFLNQRWGLVARKIHAPQSAVESACEFMRSNLCPSPLAMLEESDVGEGTLRYADIVILRDKNARPPAYALQIPGAQEWELRISAVFQKIVAAPPVINGESAAQERTWIKDLVNRAQMVIEGLGQRWQTLRRIGEYLVHSQYEFLEHGPLYLKPLSRATVAHKLGLHESTISRAVREKVALLPDGHLMPLGDFFDASLAPKEAIRELLTHTGRPLCDREIAERLQVRGIRLSRRTIAKYRQRIHLPSSHHRGKVGVVHEDS